jgi:glutaredoxin
MASIARTCWLALTAIVAATMASGVCAQQVYRYLDPATGKVVYSDRPPPQSAKDVQTKRLGGNVIDTDPVPLATRNAVDTYPVTLYTFACGEICQNAEELLNKRGVPFTSVNVEDAKEAEKLKALTGELTAPVLQVGEKLVAKGYNEARWHALLDEAGYPKTPSAPVKRAAAAPQAPRPAAAQPAAPPAQPATPRAGSGYPMN